MGSVTVLRLGFFVALGIAAAACSAEVSYGTVGGGGGGGGGTCGEPCLTGTDAGSDASRVSAGSTTPSKEPMLAHVDDNVKMNASPGQGVGVFTEYDAGGHWHVWWTCDTTLTSENCPFDVKISSEKSSITNATSESFSSEDRLTTPGSPTAGVSGGIEAKTTTTTGIQGVDFDTDPGATITLSATVGGLYNGQFLFWVQSGQVNGGYKGTVTDPLMLVGATP
jgi:hypothetical protein